MDEDLRQHQLDRAIAVRADAWLADPSDSAMYTRLVAAILERRGHLHPDLIREHADDDQTSAVDKLGATLARAEELLDEVADARPPVPIDDAVEEYLKEVDHDTLRCTFCGKHRPNVDYLIAALGDIVGTPLVHICNECVDLCVEIIAENRADDTADGEASTPETGQNPYPAHEGDSSPERPQEDQ